MLLHLIMEDISGMKLLLGFKSINVLGFFSGLFLFGETYQRDLIALTTHHFKAKAIQAKDLANFWNNTGFV